MCRTSPHANHFVTVWLMFRGAHQPLFTLGALILLLVAFPLTGTTPAPPADASTVERSRIVEGYLTEKLYCWQRNLKLQDRKVTLRMCPPAELKPSTVGNIHWDAAKRSAIIRVLDAPHYKLPYREMLDDMEFTVVHELVHLQLSSLPRSEASRGAEEYAVNRITEALLQLERR
jgi:hypothetical protein